MKHMICALLLATASLSAVGQANTHEFQLDNGLKVIVREDHRAPVVVSQIWYRVGSTYEYGGITGVSHVLEHMMFKGTDTHDPGEFSRIIAANGGKDNAFTGRDYTAYHQQLSKDRLEVSFELEADRMQGLLLKQAEFAKEVEVVKEERRLRTEDKPESLTFERFNAAAYRSSPNRIPVIGWMDDLENLQLEDIERWYRRWYSPDNATLVVVGDVDPQQVLALAKKHFEAIPSRQVVPPKPQLEGEQRGEVRVVVKAPAKQPYLIMGYKTPVLGHADEEWEPYALEMLAAVLDGGNSARFSRELVRGERLAVSASADYSAFARLPGMLTLKGTPTDAHDVAELEQALRAQISRLREEPVSPSELERVRAQIVASKVFQKDSIFYQALEIGVLESIGQGWRTEDDYVERLKRVTPEQIQAVARKYLRDDYLNVAVLEPQPMQDIETTSRTAALESQHVH